MLVVKTLILSEIAEPLSRLSIEGFTVDALTLQYGTSLAGIRYKDVHINVDPSKRNAEYDAFVRAHSAYGDLYDTMRRTDENNSRLARPSMKTRTTEEMREYLAKEVQADGE